MHTLFIAMIGMMLSILSLGFWYGAVAHHDIVQYSYRAEQRDVVVRSLYAYAIAWYDVDANLQREVLQKKKTVTRTYQVPCTLAGVGITAQFSYRLQTKQSLQITVMAFRSGQVWGQSEYLYEIPTQTMQAGNQ